MKIDFSKYPGQKNIDGVYQKIINLIPSCETYIELFAGTSAVYSKLTVQPCRTVLNDVSTDVQKYLKNKFPEATVKNVPAHKFINQKLLAAGKETFVFADPPYLHSTRPINTKLYKHEMTEHDHVQFLEAVQDLKCNFMIIHPKCELYDIKLSTWNKSKIKIRYNTKTSIEYIYFNYPVPTELLCYSYIGNDCWERQALKRKLTNILNKINSMDPTLKNALLKKINS